MTVLPADRLMGLFEAYKSAIFAKDLESFVALYDQDVRVFDIWSEFSYEGLDAWRRSVARWFSSLGDDRVEVTVDDARFVFSEEAAIISAFVTYAAISAEGKELRSTTNRLTWGLTSRGSTWKIIHEHTSAPADLESLRILKHRRT